MDELMDVSPATATEIHCQLQGCQAVLSSVIGDLSAWDHWAVASKTFAVLFGALVAAVGIAVISKEIRGRWHWIASACFAAGAFTMATLQPYEEYKQFRAAYAELAYGYLTFIASTMNGGDLNALINADVRARDKLKETWLSPTISAASGAQMSKSFEAHADDICEQVVRAASQPMMGDGRSKSNCKLRSASR